MICRSFNRHSFRRLLTFAFQVNINLCKVASAYFRHAGNPVISKVVGKRGVMNEDDVILLIEDDEDKAQLIISILRQHLRGHIRHIEDGQAAMNFLFSDESNSTRLILLDLILPNVDGIEILKRIKADPVKSGIPVIILTASSETQTYVTSLGLKPDGFAHKPGRLKDCA